MTATTAKQGPLHFHPTHTRFDHAGRAKKTANIKHTPDNDESLAPRQVSRNYLAVLAADTSPSVRACFLRMLADWMSSLFDRWDHESRLLPYLLNGLCDTVPDIRREAHACMERLGAVHEDEKDNNDRDKQELRDFREYGWKSPAEQNAAERSVASPHRAKARSSLRLWLTLFPC